MIKSLNYAPWSLLVVVACNSNHQLGVGDSDSDNTGGKRASRGGSGGAASSTAGVTQVDKGGTSATGGTTGVEATGGTIANGGTAGAVGQGGATTATGGTASGGAGVATGGMVNTAGNGGRAGVAGSAVWCHESPEEVHRLFGVTCPTDSCDPYDCYCDGTLEKVNPSWSGACPTTYCAVRAWAPSLCAGGAAPWGQVAESRCGDLRSIWVYDGAAYRKECHYRSNQLVAVSIDNDIPSFCKGYAATLRWGEAPVACSNPYVPLLSCATGAAGAGPTSTVDCYNGTTDNCAPCCAATPPDCSDKPDGYPGYICTVAAGSSGGNNISAYDCDCDCRSGQWSCECGGK